jgi:hypothetical protein
LPQISFALLLSLPMHTAMCSLNICFDKCVCYVLLVIYMVFAMCYQQNLFLVECLFSRALYIIHFLASSTVGDPVSLKDKFCYFLLSKSKRWSWEFHLEIHPCSAPPSGERFSSELSMNVLLGKLFWRKLIVRILYFSELGRHIFLEVSRSWC